MIYDFSEIKKKILEVTNEEFRVPEKNDIIHLRKLNLPEYFVDFVSDFEPLKRTFMGEVRLLPIAEIIEENKDYIPGADTPLC
jgi:hypothetical protein